MNPQNLDFTGIYGLISPVCFDYIAECNAHAYAAIIVGAVLGFVIGVSTVLFAIWMKKYGRL